MVDKQLSTQDRNNIERFWSETEYAVKWKVPTYLKTILTFTGYDNPLSMADLDSKQITELERFAREDMKYFTDKRRPLHEYYGIYEACPDRFRIVGGHAAILSRIAEYWRKFRDDTEPSTTVPGSKVPCVHNAPVPPTVKYETNSTTTSQPQLDPSWDKEERHLLEVLRESVKECIKRRPMVTQDEFLKVLPNLKVAVVRNSETNGGLVAHITCFACASVLKAHKVYDKPKPRWIYSNFQRHIKILHLGMRKPTKSPAKSPNHGKYHGNNAKGSSTGSLGDNGTEIQNLKTIVDSVSTMYSDESSNFSSEEDAEVVVKRKKVGEEDQTESLNFYSDQPNGPTPLVSMPLKETPK